MKVAITEWQGRVAPVFDVAGTVLIFETKSGEMLETAALPTLDPRSKLVFLTEQGIHVLICGAITRRMREYAEMLGIRINPFVSGEIEEVWSAWRDGTLDEACYSMPGCRHCRRRKGQCK
ncbi:NifB/NifX family molybdenum-iron cluster-binding protein [Pontiellaceae bacterium B1224]|nr:NifB/NifX family molybdenum-iron cluster-binding protein [Pontiellaceae bacterium B1224]